jgi:hypothetical protein
MPRARTVAAAAVATCLAERQVVIKPVGSFVDNGAAPAAPGS